MILYDSIDARAIPRSAVAVAGYGDGAFIWSPSWWDGSNGFDLFPNAYHLVIVVDPAHQGDVLDVERGDAVPADCPGWADRFRRPGRRRPSLYHSRGLRAPVLAAMAGRAYDWWAATLDGTQQVGGAVAVQYVDRGPYDESIIVDPSWAGGDVAVQLDPNDPVIQDLDRRLGDLEYGATPAGGYATVGEITLTLRQLLARTQAAGGLTDAQAAQLAQVPDLVAAVARIENALKGA